MEAEISEVPCMGRMRREGERMNEWMDGRVDRAYCSEKVRLSSQVTMGKLRRSLYVGRITENLSPGAAGFVGAIAYD